MTKLSLLTREESEKLQYLKKYDNKKDMKKFERAKIYNGAFRNDIPEYSHPT